MIMNNTPTKRQSQIAEGIRKHLLGNGIEPEIEYGKDGVAIVRYFKKSILMMEYHDVLIKVFPDEKVTIQIEYPMTFFDSDIREVNRKVSLYEDYVLTRDYIKESSWHLWIRRTILTKYIEETRTILNNIFYTIDATETEMGVKWYDDIPDVKQFESAESEPRWQRYFLKEYMKLLKGNQ